MATRDEILRYVYEVEGDEDLKRISNELKALGSVSGNAEGRVQKLVDELADISRAKRAAEEFQSLRKSIVDLSRQYNVAREHAEQLGSALAQTDNPTIKQRREFDRARETLEKYGAQVDAGKKKLRSLRSEFEAQGVNARKLGEAEETLAKNRKRAVGELQKEVAQEKKARAESERLAAAKTKLASGLARLRRGFSSLRSGVNDFGRSLLRITGIAGLVGSALAAIKSARIFGGAVDSAVDLQRELTKTGALAGANAEQMKRLEAAANDVGAAYGVSAQETAQALTELVRASGDADAALAQLPATMALAKAGGLDLASAATIVVQTLSQFNLSADQASRVADVLSRTANATTANVSDLGEAFTYAAPVAAQLGLSMEDTAAAIGALSQQGFQGSMAGTALRQTFIQLLQPSSNFRQELQKLGINTTNFNDVLSELAKRGDASRNAILALGDRAAPAILALVNNGKTALNSLQVSLQDVQGEADRTAKSFTDNFAGAQGKLASALDKLRRSIVEKALGPIAEGFASAAVKIREFINTAQFQKLTDAVRRFSEKGVKAVSDFISSFDFAAATNKITDFVDGAGDKFSGLFGSLKDAGNQVGTIFKVIGIAIDGLKAAVFGVATAVTGFVTVALQAFQKLAVGAQMVTGNFQGAAEASQLLKEQIGGMKAVTEEFARRAVNAGKSITHAFDESGEATERQEKKIVRIKSAFQLVSEYLESLNIKQRTAKEAQDATTQAQQQGEKAADKLANAYQTLGIKSQKAQENGLKAAKEAVDDIAKAVTTGEAKFQDLRNAMDAYAKLAGKTKDAANDVSQAFADFGDAGASNTEKVTEKTQEVKGSLEEVDGVLSDVTHSAGAAANEMANAIGSQRAEFAKTSDAAAQMFDKFVDGAFRAGTAIHKYFAGGDSGGGLVAGFAAVMSATDEVNRRIEDQRAKVERLTAQYQQFSQQGIDAFGAAGQSAQFTAANIERMLAAAKAGSDEFSLLGEQDLSGLRSALTAAASKTEQLKNEAKAADEQLASMGQSLQDQIDQIQGNQVDIENRRYREQLQQLEALAKTSGDLNSQEYLEAAARARQLHELKMQQIQQEASAKANAEQQSRSTARSSSGGGGSSTDNTVTVRFDQQSLGEVNFGSMADVQRLAQQLLPAIIQQLKLAQQRSGRPG